MDNWILCSERLPEPVNKQQKRGWYLTTNDYNSVGITCYEFSDDWRNFGWQTDLNIVAWMELPKPYVSEK